MKSHKSIGLKVITLFTFLLFFSVAVIGQEKIENKHMNHDMHKSMKMNHSNMDSTHMNHSMTDSTHHSMDSSHQLGMMKSDTSIVREEPIDLDAIDKNKDGKVYQDQMDWNVISDEPGECPICGMILKEVDKNKAKVNLISNGFKVK